MRNGDNGTSFSYQEYFGKWCDVLCSSILQKDGQIKFWEAECFKIDPDTKKLHCRTNIGTNLEGNGEFIVDYDYLVITVGARASTFNTPGVVEHCHFLKVNFHRHLFQLKMLIVLEFMTANLSFCLLY